MSSRRAAAALAANAAGATLAAGSVAATLDGARRSLAAGTGTAGSDDVYGLGGGYNPLAKAERMARSHRFGGVLSGGGGGSGSGGGNNAGDSGDGGAGGAGSTGGAWLLREPLRTLTDVLHFCVQTGFQFRRLPFFLSHSAVWTTRAIFLRLSTPSVDLFGPLLWRLPVPLLAARPAVIWTMN